MSNNKIEREQALASVRRQFEEVDGVPDTAPLAREIEFNGKIETFHFRVLDAKRMTDALKGNEADKFIAAILTDPSGLAVVTPADIGRIKPQLRHKLRMAALDVNGMLPPKVAPPVAGEEATEDRRESGDGDLGND
jgi:hypothetical protein